MQSGPCYENTILLLGLVLLQPFIAIALVPHLDHSGIIALPHTLAVTLTPALTLTLNLRFDLYRHTCTILDYRCLLLPCLSSSES